MSSILSIVNDTPDPWHCKVIKTKGISTLNWSTMATAVVAAVTTALAIKPALQVGGGFNEVYSVPDNIMVQGNYPLVPEVVHNENNPATKFSAALSESMTKYLKHHGYVPLMPGHRSTQTVKMGEKVTVDCKQVSTASSNVVLRTLGNEVSTSEKKSYCIKEWEEKAQDPQCGLNTLTEAIAGHSYPVTVFNTP